MTRYRDAWIGLDDFDEEGVFAWSDGTANEFTAWNDHEPNDWGDAGEDCAGFWAGNGKWNDFHCDATLNYICRYATPQ